jgi:hypothetical protein
VGGGLSDFVEASDVSTCSLSCGSSFILRGRPRFSFSIVYQIYINKLFEINNK